jgi:hypothetical protein
MVAYNCLMCDYGSEHKTAMTKHNNTKKHIEKERNNNTNTNTTNKCKHCEMTFAYLSGLSRHLKVCTEKEHVLEKSTSKLSEAYKEIETLKNELDRMKEYVKENIADKNSFKFIAENNSEANKASSNALSYVINNYKNAQPIHSFTNFELLKEENKKLSIAEIAIGYNIKGVLAKFLGDKLIKEYKKDKNDIKTQAIWNSDISRLTYLVCEPLQIDNTNIIDEESDRVGEWTTDKGGDITARYIISPMMEHITKGLQEYIDNGKNLFDGHNNGTIVNKMIQAQLVINNIKSNDLSNDIMKYLAKHFALTKKKPVKKLH